jgi:hypothetical protein
MKKRIIIAQLTIGLLFITNASIAQQEEAKKIEPIPQSVLQKRVEPTYTAPASIQRSEAAVKATIALQTKAQKEAIKKVQTPNAIEQKEEILQPVVAPLDVMQPTAATTIDTKLNTDNYYKHKPIIDKEPTQPVQAIQPVSKPVTQEKNAKKPKLATIE